MLRKVRRLGKLYGGEGGIRTLILKGGAADRINAKMVQLEGRKAELEQQLTDAEAPPPQRKDKTAKTAR
ncbi:hypothetical protein [Bradyrhizobium retamae]|uniref:Uncharacterized protein n=1 Tax=Bradyrhizobium retamae TaxID=1300035 RepID=A0A0R3MEE1_9BRAD|nr:hypothetical protein [Bradyrhizobium retamae]KRR18330.1 hypothetical protein CQ13_35110 [Bradyrhizobium retamae]